MFVLRSIPVVEKIFFVQNLALMVKTGFSMSDALRTLAEQTSTKPFKIIIEHMHQAVLRGETFTAALQLHPEAFDNLFTSMVNAGETSGNLEHTLFQLAAQLKKAYALKKKIRNAMIYPVLIIVVMIVVGTGLFIFVVPKILDLYLASGYTLPLPTRIILWLSDFISSNALLLIGTVSIISVSAYAWGRTEAGKMFYSQVVLRLPIAAKIIKRIHVAKIARLLNSFIITDISIVKGYTIIAKTLRNRVYRRHLEHASESLTKGNSIYSTLSSRPDLFDTIVAQMVKVGEDTGALEQMTQEIAEFYEAEVDSTMSNLTVIIEPVLMIVIGFGVGFLAVAIILPIYGLVEQV